MNVEAAKENRMTLQNLLGVSEEKAEKILGSFVLITGGQSDTNLVQCSIDVLEKTFENVSDIFNPDLSYNCEIVIGGAIPCTAGPHVFVCEQEKNNFLISLKRSSGSLQNHHPFISFLISCYVAALVVKVVAGEKLPFFIEDEINVELDKIITNRLVFDTEIDVGESYLAGAGAVGNSFLYALSKFNVKGLMHVVDADIVSGGNLNRCLFFTNDDIEQNKVDALIYHSQPLFPQLTLLPIPELLQNAPAAKKGGPWLKKLIVGVDSRRARRNLQNELPGEVFDASTTRIEEVVIHYHKNPLNGKACLGCIYHKEQEEQAHEKHIANQLGVSLEQIGEQFINENAALLISAKYSVEPSEIVGLAYDTLFKQLCGEGKLQIEENKQVLAPLAFVSGLAGAFLALNFVSNNIMPLPYNYWRVSPWRSPNFRLQQSRHTNPECEFCNNEITKDVIRSFWP